ncbi:hypothetical protein VMCG_01903 [Cytospora schulzeri]|uniref:Uncharacterized protein n=1 Tax=Cytospora schulzeri TaxID=448051 RepID=A0A423X370_9PEZI|nr:hypothetical protein VMCG_01903 [Valsa malicola]
MAKKKAPAIQQRAMYSRMSFLYQAATCMAIIDAGNSESAKSTQTTPPAAADSDAHMEDGHKDDYKVGINHDGNPPPTTQALSRKLLTDLRSVTLKTQIRMNSDIKRTICKYCDTLLVEGQTCTSTVENQSKGGRKPWADLLTIKCHTCSQTRRYPVNAPRQKRRPLRIAEQQNQKATQGATEEAAIINLQPQPQNQETT